MLVALRWNPDNWLAISKNFVNLSFILVGYCGYVSQELNSIGGRSGSSCNRLSSQADNIPRSRFEQHSLNRALENLPTWLSHGPGLYASHQTCQTSSAQCTHTRKAWWSGQVSLVSLTSWRSRTINTYIDDPSQLSKLREGQAYLGPKSRKSWITVFGQLYTILRGEALGRLDPVFSGNTEVTAGQSRAARRYSISQYSHFPSKRDDQMRNSKQASSVCIHGYSNIKTVSFDASVLVGLCYSRQILQHNVA